MGYSVKLILDPWSWWWKRFFIHHTGILLAVDNGKRGEIYIVGGERPVTKMHLVHTIADALGVRNTPTAGVTGGFNSGIFGA